MSARKKKEMRQGYRQAGAIYWTTEMEHIIRRLRLSRMIGWMIAAIEAMFVIGNILRNSGVF